MAEWIALAGAAALAATQLPLPDAPAERASACEMIIHVAAGKVILQEKPDPAAEARLISGLVAWRERAEAVPGYDQDRHLARMEGYRDAADGASEALETCLAEVETTPAD